ncbi:MAG: hypothetical protein B6I28_05675 [Fusobacteriia bacterium 4572_132]|nr:MAG: hypothetical protein B6I28_05675 [Fusobacteriia bacterium 4572_132]
MKKLTLITLLLFSISIFGNNFKTFSIIQSMKTTKFSIKNGLPSNSITSIIQDNKGYIWFGTYEGLVRFDGVKFKIFNEDFKKFLPSISTRVILQTRDNKIWIGTNGDGILVLDNSNFSAFYPDLKDKPIRSMYEAKDNKVWIGTTEGIFYFDQNKITKLNLGITLNNSTIQSIFEDNNGNLLFSSNRGGLYRITNNLISKISYEGIDLSKYIINDVAIDKNNKIYLGTRESGIIVIENHKLLKFINKNTGFPTNKINTIKINSKNKILCGTEKGFYLIYNDIIEQMTSKEDLSDELIDAILEDAEGNLWIGMSHGGIVKLSSMKFFKYATEHGLKNNTVNVISQLKKDTAIVGTDKGLNIISNKRIIKNKLTHFLSNIRIRHILPASDGLIYIATYSDFGVVIYNPITSEIKTLNTDNGLTSNRVRIIFEDSQKNIWIGTTSGLNKYSNGKVIKTYKRKDGLTNDYILSIGQSNKNKILLGTDGGGINIINTNNNIISSITSKDGLPSNIIFKILTDSEGDLWISSTGGVTLIKNNNIYNLIRKNNLPQRTICQIINDDDDNSWIITPKMILRASTTILKKKIIAGKGFSNFKIYDMQDGLTSGVGATSWSISDNQNTLWFSTNNGVATLDLTKVNLNKIKPPVTIESVLLDDVTIPLSKTVILPPNNKRININYTALSFVVPEKVKFLYKLEGFDKDWSKLTTNRQATYTNLPPGNYTFLVKAVNNDGIWSDYNAEIKLKKEPFFYQTILFYLLITFLIILITSFGFYLKFRILKKRQIELKKIVNERTHELKEEKDKSDKLLLNILPKKVADELKEKGKYSPEIFDNTSILFADIVGFTKKVENMNSEDLINELNDIFSAFDKISKKHNCERIKTIGDAYMAVSGISKKDPNHASNMIDSAFEMRDYLINRKRKINNQWQMRFGINSGSIIGGVVGTDKYIYDIFGDAINTASRLETFSQPMKINLSEYTYQLVKEKYKFQKRERIEVKSKGVLDMYFVEPLE